MTTVAVLKMKNKALHSKNSKNCTHVFLAIFTTWDTTNSRQLFTSLVCHIQNEKFFEKVIFYLIVSCYLIPSASFWWKKKAKKRVFYQKNALGTRVSCYLSFKVLFNNFLNFLQPLSWNNTDRRKWWESWPLQMEVGILLGTLVVNCSKIHSYLVKPHHASIGGAEDSI